MQATYNNSMTKTARVFFGKSIKSQTYIVLIRIGITFGNQRFL